MAERDGFDPEIRELRATAYKWEAPEAIPPREWLYGRHLVRRFVSATIAPGGAGKSSLLIAEALAMATGKPLLGDRPDGKLRVWLWNGEDPAEETRRRIAAGCKFFGIEPADLGDRLFVDSGRDMPLTLARDGARGLEIVEADVAGLEGALRNSAIDVLVIDPFVAAHMVSENDNTKIEAVVRQLVRVAEGAGCAIELLHHVRKPGMGQAEAVVDDARGASALIAKARSARVLNVMSAEEALAAGVEEAERLSFFRVDNGKANLAPRSQAVAWRKLVSVDLDNGHPRPSDHVGVATPWEKPDLFAGVSTLDLQLVQAAIRKGEWRRDPQSPDWAGRGVAEALGLDLNDKRHRARITKMLKTWCAEGVLIEVQRKDANRQLRWFVEAGKAIEGDS
jgi:RecA-family ATPase